MSTITVIGLYDHDLSQTAYRERFSLLQYTLYPTIQYAARVDCGSRYCQQSRGLYHVSVATQSVLNSGLLLR